MATVQHKTLTGTDLHAAETEYAGTPNGNLSGWKNQYCRDTVTGDIYRCTSGTPASPSMAWELVVDKSHFTDTNNPHDVAPDQLTITDTYDRIVATEVDGALDELSGKFVEKANMQDLNIDKMFPVRMCCVRNKEMNNLLATSAGVEITVSAINTTTDQITLSWLPYIPSIWSPESGKEWALLRLEDLVGSDPSRSGDYINGLKINSGTYSTRVLNYTNCRGADTNWVVGDRVMLYNPFLWDRSANNPIINISSTPGNWRYHQVMPAGIFRHSNGKWIMLVNGWSDSTSIPTRDPSSIGAFESTDLETWSVLNSDAAIFTPSGGGTGDWRADGLRGYTVMKLRNEDRYIMYVTGYNKTDNIYRMGWVKFDENFSSGSIEWAAAEILDSSGKGGSGGGYYQASAVYYGGRYRLFCVDRMDNANPDTATNPWESVEAFSDTPEGPFTGKTTICAGRLTNDGTPRSSHTGPHGAFVYNDTLYLIVGMTARYSYSGMRGNRMFGLFNFDDKIASPAWREDPRSPVFINPIYGDDIWSEDYDWEADHLGEGGNIFITNGRAYILYSGNHGTDTYKVGIASMNL